MLIETKTKPAEFLAIYLDSLRLDTELKFNLYLERETGYFLYRDSHLPFTEDIRQSLSRRNIHKLYVSFTDLSSYQEYIEDNLNSILNNNSIDISTKSKLVYNTTNGIIQDALSNPTTSKNIKRSKSIVESTVSYTLNENRSFLLRTDTGILVLPIS